RDGELRQLERFLRIGRGGEGAFQTEALTDRPGAKKRSVLDQDPPIAGRGAFEESPQRIGRLAIRGGRRAGFSSRFREQGGDLGERRRGGEGDRSRHLASERFRIALCRGRRFRPTLSFGN